MAKNKNYDLNQLPPYVNEIFSTLIIENIYSLNNKNIFEIENIKSELKNYIKNFMNYSDLKRIANIKDDLEIEVMIENIINNNIVFLQELKFLDNKKDTLKIDDKFLNKYNNYNSKKEFRKFVVDEIQNNLLIHIYNSKLFLLTPSVGKTEQLQLQEAIIKEDLLSEDKIEKYLAGDLEIKNEKLLLKLIEITNNNNSILKVKEELKKILLMNKSLKTKSLNFTSLNFFKWTFSNDLLEYINIFKETSINSKRTLLLDKLDGLKLISKVLDEKDLLERLKIEFKQNLNQLNHFEVEKLPEILTNEYILEVVKKNYFGNYVDFICNLLNTDLNAIPYEEMENFEEIIKNFDSKIRKMVLNNKEKMVFVIDALDLDGRSCETVASLFKNIIVKNYNISSEQIIIVPSINPKNDERGFNLTTVKATYNSNLIKDGDIVTFVTADNGINNIASIRAIKKYTSEKNIASEYIITDHHGLINHEILDEPEVLVLDQELEENYHLFEGYNSCGAYLLKEVFNHLSEKLKKVPKKDLIEFKKMIDKIGVIANRADLVPTKERIPTDSTISNSINKMNAIFSSSNLFVLAAKYVDGIVSKDYIIKEVKGLYALENEKSAEEIINRLTYILKKSNNLYEMFEEIILNKNETLTKVDMTSKIISNQSEKCLSKTGDPAVYKLIKMKLTELSLDYKSELSFMLFNEVDNLIKNVKNLEQSLLKYKSSSLDIENMEIDVIDYKNIIIFNIDSLSGSSEQTISDIFYGDMNEENMLNEELNRKAWNKIFRLNPNMPKNISDKPVVLVGAFDKQSGAFKGSVRTKSSEFSTYEVFYHYKKQDLVNILGHANAAGIELFFKDKNITNKTTFLEALDKVAARINRVVGQKKLHINTENAIYVLNDTKYLGMLTQIENVALLSAAPQQHHFSLLIKADELVFNNSNDLKNNKYNVLENNSDAIKDGWYIAPILFKPEVSVLISASDLANTKKSDYLNLSYMSNGSFMVSGIVTKQELEKMKNTQVLEMYPRTLESNDMDDKIIEKIDEHTVVYNFEDVLRASKYYAIEEDQTKVEKHLQFLKLMVQKYGKILVTDIETTGLGRLEKITNVGFAGLYFNDKKELELEVNHMLINVEGVPNSIMNLTDIYKKDLIEKGVPIEKAQELTANILLKYQDALLIAHNGFNFDFRVLEGIVELDNYFDNMLDSMDLVRSNKVAMDNDSNFKIEYKGKVLGGIFSDANPHFINGISEFLNSDKNSIHWLSVDGTKKLYKDDNKIFYFDKKTNIIEELELNEINIKSYSLRAKSAVQRLSELQIINALRKNIIEPKDLKNNVLNNILSLDYFDKNQIEEYVELFKIIIENINLSHSTNHNLETLKEIINSELLDKIEKLNIDDKKFNLEDELSSILKMVERTFKQEVLKTEEPLLLYKYFNIDELLHSIEIYNSDNDYEENLNKIMKFTNLRYVDVQKFLELIEPLKEMLRDMKETHNNTANVYSDHVQEFNFLVVKTMIDNLPKHYTAEKMFELYDENIKNMKAKYYFYKNFSEEYKPIGMNKFMFKQLLQQLETYTEEQQSVYKRLKDLSELLSNGKILIELDGRAYEIEYPFIDLKNISNILIGGKEFDIVAINEFMLIVKNLEEIIKLQQQQEIIDLNFSKGSCDINFSKALDNNTNGRGKNEDGSKKVFIPNFTDNIDSLDENELKKIISSAKRLKNEYEKLEIYEKEKEELAKNKEFSTSSEIIVKYESLIEAIDLGYENLNDKNKSTKISTKIDKLDKIIKYLNNNLLFIESNDHFSTLKENLQLKMNQLKINSTNIVERDLRTKDITKELITKDYLKIGIFVSLEEKDQLDIIQKYIQYKSFTNKNKEIVYPKTIEEFLNTEYGSEMLEVSNIQGQIQYSQNNKESIKTGNTSGNRIDLYGLILSTAQMDMKINPQLEEIVNRSSLEKASTIIKDNIDFKN